VTPIDLNAGSWWATIYTGHNGTSYRALDFNLPGDAEKGLAVKAVASGTVVNVISANGQVQILHDVPLTLLDGSREYHTWYSNYCHMDIATGISIGTYINAGDTLGYISNNSSSGPIKTHLHFGISTYLKNGKWTDQTGHKDDTISPGWVWESFKTSNFSYKPYSPSHKDVINRYTMDSISQAPPSN
jgi:murein DD-endopeptidase MepM/ murein hydrolase activator NlpD